MKSTQLGTRFSLLLALLFSLFFHSQSVASNDNDDWSLGSIGGTFRVQPGTNYLEVKSIEPTGPGGTAGLQVGDYIYKAFGVPFGELSVHSTQGYKGSVQDLAIAMERAESGNGALELTVMRPGTGDVVVNITLPAAGAFGPAYPLGSQKYDAMYQWSCEEIHSQVTASSDGNFGYNTGLMGMILLSHPNWNDTTGDKPYRLSVNKIRDWCVTYINERIEDPVEATNLDGTPNDGSVDDSNPNDQSWVNSGLENWSVATASMFLAELRQKTGDASLDVHLQVAANCLANRVQEYQQPMEDGSAGPTKLGLMGHGGVTGDYAHVSYAGINIINAHVLPAMAMLSKAGANVDATQFYHCWQRMKDCTRQDGGSEDGNVGYAWVQGGSDSSGRTAGAVAGMLMNGGVSADDQAVVDRQIAYLVRHWQRIQHCHAYTVGGVVLYQFALPYLSDREQRFIMENTRHFYHFHRNTNGSLTYFGGRENNGGDGYLNTGRAAMINVAMTQAIHSGNLPSFPAINSQRLHADFISPALTWPDIDARYLKTDSGSVEFSNVNVTNYLGTVLNSSDYSVTWSHISGPATAGFSNASSATTTINLPAQGRYRVQLQVSKDGYTLTEPIDIDYFPGTIPNGYTGGAITEEIYTDINGTEVSNLTSDAKYPNSPDITKSISSIEGTHDGNYYGSRLRGFIVPPVTGDYTFYVSGDNNADFYLSSDDTEANKVKICHTTTWTDIHEWDQNPEQTSAVQSLTAGQAYFFEVVHKANSGGDHVAVAWTLPGITAPEVIGSQYIALEGSGATTIVSQPQDASVAAGGDVTLSLSVTGAGPFIYQWRKDGVAYWPASSTADLALTNVGAGAAGQYDCVVTAPDGTVTSTSATLTVTGVGVLTTGGLWRDVFSDIGGTEVSDLTTQGNYPYFPDSGAVITQMETPQNEAETYGSRWTGWLKPDVTGAHTFYLTGDNTAELWLSTDDQPANIVKIASLATWTNYRDWDGGSVSADINLVAGNRYYIEVRHKESKGGDHCGVAWRKPGEAVPADGADAAIPGQYLEYLTGGVYFTHTSVSLSRVEPASDSVKIRPDLGILLECSASTVSPNATVTWTKQSGPGEVTFSDVSSLATDATFSAEGNYVLRCTYDNGGVPATYDISVEVTSEVSASWNSVSIAEPTAGSGTDNGDGSFTVLGSGSDIYGSSDQCHMYYQNITGDFDVRTRIASKSILGGQFTYGNHAQLMARESTAANARNIAVTHEQSARVAFQYRSTVGGQTNYEPIDAAGLELPLWIRLVRSGGNLATGAAGQTFTGYYSTDNGATWIQRETITFGAAMPETLLVGFAVSAGGSSLNTTVFDNVSGFAGSENIAAVPDAGSDSTSASLTAVALSGSSTDDSLPTTPGTVTNLWSQISGPGAATFADASAASTTVDFSVPGEYVLRLRSDDGSAKTYDEVTITAVADFSVSIAATDNAAAGDGSDAGEFTVTRTGATSSALTVNLNIAGSASNGVDYTSIANTVEIPAGQASVIIALSPLFDAVQEGAETVEIGIAAGNYNSVATPAVVTISDTVGVHAPVINNATFAVAENLTAGAAVGTVTVTDSDNGDAHSFTITAGNTGGAFAINNQGEITTAAVLDRETIASYTLTLEVTDSGALTDTASITVNVTDVYEVPMAIADNLAINANAASGAVDVMANDFANDGNTAALLGFASAAVVYEAGTSGSPQNPTVSGWAEFETEEGDPNSGNVTATASIDHNGSGLDAWLITDNTGSGGQWVHYRKAPTAAEITAGNNNGWVLETKMRLADDFNAGAAVQVEYGNGSKRFLVFYDLNGDDDLTAQLFGTGGGTYTLTSGGTGADAFHDIVVLYDPAKQTASFVVDGVRIDEGAWTGQSSGATGLEWGTESSGGRGSAAFHSVKWSYFDTTGTLASGATVSSSGSSVTFNPNGAYDYLLATESVDEVVTYAMADGGGHFTMGTLTVSVQGVDDLPSFDSDPVVAPNANSIFAYTGATLADFGRDPDDAYTFSKVSGPAWLTVASDGSLTGAPSSSDAGLNTFTVEVSNGKAQSAQTTLEITVDSSINIYSEDFETYDVENPSDFSVSGIASSNWTSSDSASNATRIFNTGNFGGSRLWISNVDGTSITSAGVDVDSQRDYTMSVVLVTETGGSSTTNATYDILVGQSAATATSVIGGAQSVIARGDAYQVSDSKTDHVFTHNFQTSDLAAGDKVFLRYSRVNGSGWFGVDDVKLDLVGLAAPADSDADNLDDSWEMTHFGNLTSTDGSIDSDLDGQTDAAEYAAKTSPMDATDLLRILAHNKGASDAYIQWSAKAGVSYRVEYSYDLTNWHTVVSGQSGAGAQLDHTDADATRMAASKVFYRVIVE